MKIPTIHTSNVKAYVLFTTISVLFIATAFVLSFYTTLYSKELRINYKIAETQALFNAETGVAEGRTTRGVGLQQRNSRINIRHD